MKKKIANTANTISYSLRFLIKNDRIYLFLKLLGILPSVLCNVLAVTLPKYIIDSLAEDRSVELAFLYTFFLAGSMVLGSLCSEGIRKVLSVRGTALDHVMRRELLKTASVMDYDALEDPGTLDQFEYAKASLDEAGIVSVVDILLAALSSLFSLTAYFYIVLRYSYVFVPLIVLSVAVNIAAQGKKKSMYVQIQEESSALNRKIRYASRSLMDNAFAKEIRLFQLKCFLMGKYDTFMQTMYGMEYRYLKETAPLHVFVSAVGALQILAAYGVVGYSLQEGSITVGVFVQYTSAFFAMSAAIAAVTSSFVELSTKWMYLSSYEDFLAKGRELDRDPAPAVPAKDFLSLELKDVSFRYPESAEYVLRDLNLTIHANEKISIVGANGAGKTTLIKLLLGMYKPTHGEILLDGVPVQSMEFRTYMRYFSAVFQDCTLLDYSVAENIALDEEYSSERMHKIFSQLRLDNKIGSLKKGVDTYVTRSLDAEGADMSGGERQKLMIARALYKDAPVLILDEPTAALSADSEYEIYQSFSEVTEDKAVLYISHRLASCRLCSRILVVKDGVVAEDGSFEELMKSGGVFAEMYEAQADCYR